MKKIAILAAAAISLAGAAFADPAEGVWKTEVDDGAYAYVTMSKCGEKICGVISRTFKSGGEYKSDNIGKPIVWDMVPGNGGSYGSGKIWQPSTGKVYKSKMSLSGSTMQVSGCVGPICKKQKWSKVN